MNDILVTASTLWEEFKKDARYQDIISDLTARRELLVGDLVRGPEIGTTPQNTDSELRKRINEIDYVLQLVDSFIMDCKYAEEGRETQKDDKENSDEQES